MYKPRAEQTAILDRAIELVQSVSYKVSLRWLFYRLLQEGIYKNKTDYANLKTILSKARKGFSNGWTPDTLADDTRQAYIRGTGFYSEDTFLKAVGKAECTLDKWQYQDNYVELWYEAKAMHGQFAYYTEHITLRPFGGDPSIPYKWNIAKELEEAWERYELPITIIYFGDLDPKGLTIPENAIKDIRQWCSVEFKFIRAGLNPGDEVRYGIPENFERPGTFQWEALNDDQARQLIQSTVGEFVSQGQFKNAEEEEQEITTNFQELWTEFTREYGN
jgi:hypothetical protein